MKIEIEQYKGQTIYYNEDNDKFECDISIEDNAKSTKRQSLKDVRKEIDTFIKLNLNFVPFKVLTKSWGDEINVRDVLAIRTDGKFVITDNYGSSYKSQSEMHSYYTYDPIIVKEYEIIDKELKIANNKGSKAKEELVKRLQPVDVSKYKYILPQEEKSENE